MKKGQQTKELLLEAAKEEFREVGYFNASVNGITKRIGAQPSLLSYHFKNINTIIQVINRDFHARIWEELQNRNIKDPLTFLFAYDILINTATHSTPQSRRFKCESSASNKVSMYAIMSSSNTVPEIDDSFYDEILEKHNIILPRSMIYNLRLQESAGRRELFIHYYEKDAYKKLSEDEWYRLSVTISYCTVTTLFRFAGIPNETIDKCFYEAFDIISGIEPEKVRLL